MDAKEKTWWAPVWRGLVADPKAKHYRRMGTALWLFLYLILHADRPTGVAKPKLATIARQTGIPRRTLQRWLRRLRTAGYISTERTGRADRIGIIAWKNTRRCASSGGSEASNVARERRQEWRRERLENG